MPIIEIQIAAPDIIHILRQSHIKH